MIVAVVQARMSSTRLPGKVLVDLGGRPMLGRVVARTSRGRTIDRVVVATSIDPSDDPVEVFCRRESIPCHRGSLEDVLDRYRSAAREVGATVVVRITADCPLIDPAVVDLVVEAFLEGGCDYASNTLEPTFPDGLDVEVFSADALERAWGEATWRSEREHVTPYLKKHPETFRLRNVRGEVDRSGLRWTVDEPADLEFVRSVFESLAEPFGTREVLELLGVRPELGRANAGIERDEGYRRSIEADRRIDAPVEGS